MTTPTAPRDLRPGMAFEFDHVDADYRVTPRRVTVHHVEFVPGAARRWLVEGVYADTGSDFRLYYRPHERLAVVS